MPETPRQSAPGSTIGSTRQPIRALDPILVNQIAAGEVIERPASVVKELVENAIDAGASSIRIDLEQGGIELVRITDDGVGIPADELHLAIHPHATSKIHDQAGLERIATLGFRGEALASIASVSRLSIRSRTHDHPDASIIRCDGGHSADPAPAAGPPGTMIEVRNLFFNTPARRKFLRTPVTEQTRCMEWIRDLALAHPHIGVTATGDGKVKLDLPRGQSPRERSIEILGRDVESQLIEIHADRLDDERGVAIWGLVGRPAIARGTNKHQHVFLNGRAIKDKTVQHAIREAYRGLIDPTRHPTAVIMIEMAPTAFDVNVHPAKLEVRFRDRSMVHSLVHRTIRDALRLHDLTPSAGARILEPKADASTPDATTRELVDFMRDAPRDAIFGSGMPTSDASSPSSPHAEFVPSRPHPAGPMPGPRRAERVLQVHSSYLVTEDDDGVVIIDQHALHERVMFEKLLHRLTGPDAGETLESQRLLTPAPVDVSSDQLEAAESMTPLFTRLGIDVSAIGPSTLGVYAFPSILISRGVEPAAFMDELLAKAATDGLPPEEEAALHEVLDMMACKAAVKAGDPLPEEDLAELLRLRDTVSRSTSCPHGRPTSVRLTLDQLEKLFDRR